MMELPEAVALAGQMNGAVRGKLGVGTVDLWTIVSYAAMVPPH